MSYFYRLRSLFSLIALVSSLTLGLAACAPAATPSPTSPPAAKPTEAPKPAAQPATSPATAAAASPSAAPAAVPAGSPATTGAAPATLRMAFVPSTDSAKVLASGKPIGDLLSKEIGIPVDVSVPTSYAAVVEALGANQLEVAWLAPFSYVVAHQKFGAEVILSSVRQGSKTYLAQIITPADSPIKEVKDIKGKKFAFVDAASASGYLYPSALLKDNGVDPKKDVEAVFAGGHDKVVIAVYNKQVDAGATFGDSSESGPPTEARTLVRSTLPDVMDKVKILAKTEPIPNDTVSVRRGLSPDLVTKVRAGLLKVAEGGAGKQSLQDLYRIDGLSEAADKDYDGLRRVAQAVGFDFEEQLKPK